MSRTTSGMTETYYTHYSTLFLKRNERKSQHLQSQTFVQLKIMRMFCQMFFIFIPYIMKTHSHIHTHTKTDKQTDRLTGRKTHTHPPTHAPTHTQVLVVFWSRRWMLSQRCHVVFPKSLLRPKTNVVTTLLSTSVFRPGINVAATT